MGIKKYDMEYDHMEECVGGEFVRVEDVVRLIRGTAGENDQYGELLITKLLEE